MSKWMLHPSNGIKKYVSDQKAALLQAAGWTVTTAPPDGYTPPTDPNSPVTKAQLDAALAAIPGGGDLPEVAVRTTAAPGTDLVGKTTRYNTTGGAINQTLPAATAGRVVAIGWDAGTAALTLVGAMQGGVQDVIGAGTATSHVVPLPGEVLTFHCTTAGRWRVTSGFKPQSALDARFIAADKTGAAVGSLSALRRSQDGTSYSLEQALGGKAQSVGKEFRLVLAGDQTGGIGGNGTVNGDTDSTPKLTIQSWQSPHGPNVGGFGQGIRLDVMHPLAKNLLVWRMPKDPTTAWSETNYLQDVLWMGAHYRHTNPDNTPGDVGAHFHWSIEIPDANGALQTRWQIKIGDVATGKIGLDRTNIVTSNADTTIAAENGMFRLAADTAAKIIEFAQNQPGTGKFFQLKVDGAANNDLILTRYLSDSNSFTAMRVQRSTGRVAFGQAAVEAGAAFTLAWSEPTDRGFVAKPSVSTTTNAAFTALLAATTDRAIDIRDAAGSTPIFEVSGTGVLAWGPGSAGRDTNLYRAAADLLATDDAFRLANRGTAPGTPSAAAVIYAASGVLTAKNASGDVISLAKQTAVADVTGGTTIDTETRTALNALLARLRTIGLIAA